MQPADWPAVRAIYADGLATGTATFETTVPAWEAWDAAHLAACRLVAEPETAESHAAEPEAAPERAARLVGWAALAPVSARRVYAGVAEVSIYVAAGARGCGVGRALLGALVAASEAAGLWTLQAVILAENTASAALHAAAGFRLVGRRERLGCLHGRWRDVLLYERRSAVVGVE